ncbi:MAG: diacylglycerol kinase family lipid kinase [Chloroflexota bacterium]|nr:diacylglycerol kinase family lipid kinase [Chloroflexota bacterium]
MQEDMLQERVDNVAPDYYAVVIANPTAGSFSQQRPKLDETLNNLRQQGWKVDLKLTEAAGDASVLARKAVEQGANVVISVGGDGTINEVIQELAGSETALGVLPGGTVNVWAREVGIPLEYTGACKVLLHGQTRRIDLGSVNGRYFLLMAGVGLDGEVAHAMQTNKKSIKRLGYLGYLLLGTWMGLGYPSFNARLHMNKRSVRVRALQITVGNTQLYGGTVKFTWQAKCDDGLLDVCVVRKRSMLGRVVVFWDFLFRRKERRQWVRYETCRSIEVHARDPLPIQLDGDAAGYTPATFTVVPGALKVIVPEHIATEGLFSKEPVTASA